MKICFMCDLHLPFDKNALQYRVLDWAINDINKKKPDCVAFVGDATADGNKSVYDWFIKQMQSINLPFLFIPGNSDLRSEQYEMVHNKASICKSVIEDISIFAINDSDKNISEEQLNILNNAGVDDIVFMHHPIRSLSSFTREKMETWRKKHIHTKLFYGHCHKWEESENSVSLQAMDPDKAIGESPCIVYYDTETKKCRKAYYFCPVPLDMYKYFGVSCYRVESDIRFAVEKGLKYLELRPSVLEVQKDKLFELVADWRRRGGENLSVHLTDVGFDGEKVTTDTRYERLIELGAQLNAERFTQHVPRTSVKLVKQDKSVLGKICSYIAERLNKIEYDCVIGVENMHMTKSDSLDDSRRFGYTPEETLQFMEALAVKCKHRVGINFDIGHARNNMPFSQKYQISTWFSLLGKHIVGYHIHQVIQKENGFENHMPITEIYGRLISYASFFRCWSEGDIKHAPIIFEMRPENAYHITIATFDWYKNKHVTDIHAHTYYSHCSEDDPHNVIRTAIVNGISVLGFSDHNYGIGKRKEQYLKEIRSLAEEYKNKVKILCGIEIATLSRFDPQDSEEIKNYDYCLIEHIDDSNSIVGEDLFGFCKALRIPCGIAHTDLFAYCDEHGYKYEEFFKKLSDNDIFWEMNVSYDSIHKYREHSYVLDFMQDQGKMDIVKKAGLFVSVGFDGHRYEDYDGNKVHQMYDFLKNNQIKTIDEKFGW